MALVCDYIEASNKYYFARFSDIQRSRFTSPFLRVSMVLLSLSFAPVAFADAGHDVHGYSHHAAGTCIDEASCSALGMAYREETVCSHGVRETYVSFWEDDHWYRITSHPECFHASGEYWVGPYAVSFIWWKSDIAPECDQSPYAPLCPADPVEFVLEVPQQPCDPCEKNNRSNPIDPATGNKYQREVDFSSPAAGGLSFSRHYNSRGASKTGSNFGAGWRHSYSASIDEEPDRFPTVSLPDTSQQSDSYSTAADACTSGWNDVKATAYGGMYSSGTATYIGESTCEIELAGSIVAYMTVRSNSGWPFFALPSGFKTISRPEGVTVKFELESGVWVSKLDSSLQLAQSGSNWVFTDANDVKETFNASGQLISRAQRNGQTETLDYALTAVQGGDDDNTTLDRVTGPFGHTLTFDYDVDGRLSTVVTPDGSIQYAYDAHDNLISATYPDSSVRQYHYDYGIFPNHLTGKTDENNDLFASWQYDSAGRARSSEHAGGIENVEFAYNTDGTTTLTMANGAIRHYDYVAEQGMLKLSMLSGDVCSTCPGGDISNFSYDSNGFVYEATDWNGNTTRTARNARGLTETRIDALGSTDARTTTTTWHSTFKLPLSVMSPKNTTSYTYDSDGNVLTVTITGGLKTRTWTFTYNSDSQPLTIDGPRTDVTDVTTLDYYACSTGNECGQLKTITNALGHVTNFNTYDSAGRLTQMTDPNGLQTTMTYDSRGRVLTTTQTPLIGAARTTTLTYDSVGQVATMTMPDGMALTYVYDAAHLLQSVTDNLGNYIAYSYNSMGDLIDEDAYDVSSVLTRTMAYARDLNDRLDAVTDGGFTTDLTYDLVGNLTAETDANSNTTQQTYDALNRLDTLTDALSGVVDYDYDDNDNVTQVVAANGATTTYVYDDLDNLVSEASPDRGVTTYTYDDAGNRLTSTDARSITTTYTYDALNRLKTVSYPDTAENISYTYDNIAASGIGRVATISDQSGTATYAYNSFGDIVSDSKLISGVTLTTTYSHDLMGQFASITYPSGRLITYGRDVRGQVTTVTSTMNGVQKNIVTSASYEPFGPMKSLTYGNGLTFDYAHRLDYRPVSISAPTLVDKTYLYDSVGNITTINDGNDSDLKRDYGYDNLNRLTSEALVSTYAGMVMADSPLAYWRLGEASGTTAVDLTGNHDGTYVDTVMLGEPGLVAGTDTAMRIDTQGAGYVDGPTFSGTPITGVEAWFQTDDNASHRDFFSLNKSKSKRMIVSHRTNGYLSILMGSTIKLSSDNVVSTGVPHHFALWYDAVTNKTHMMIDGVVQQNTFTGSLFTTQDPWVIIAGFKHSSVTRRFKGEIDEIAIYDTPVTSATFANRTLPVGAGSAFSNLFTYDANGNRLTFDDGSTTDTNTYQALTNRLATVAGSTVQLDANGNMTADGSGTRTYGYDDSNRLDEVFDGGVLTATYVHNALGQRVKKTTGGVDTIYVYDISGTLLAEHDGVGTLVRDYGLVDGVPIAQIESNESISYIHFDHLGTPRQATNDNQTIVWRWDGDAFGSVLPNEDPDGDSTSRTVNLRFPGQYFDAEAGLNYNYFRTYDPSTGRYLESDPIGLQGGLNTYGYVGENPLSYIDPLGLDIVTTSISPNPNTTLATPVCSNGSFGVKFFRKDPCIQDCAIKHEMFHIDRIRAKRPNICSGVTFSYFGYTDGDFARREGDEEYSGRLLELQCLEKKSKTVCFSPDCEKRVNERIDELKGQLWGL